MPFHYVWVIVAALAVAQMIGLAVGWAAGVLVQPLKDEFGFGIGDIGLSFGPLLSGCRYLRSDCRLDGGPVRREKGVSTQRNPLHHHLGASGFHGPPVEPSLFLRCAAWRSPSHFHGASDGCGSHVVQPTLGNGTGVLWAASASAPPCSPRCCPSW